MRRISEFIQANHTASSELANKLILTSTAYSITTILNSNRSRNYQSFILLNELFSQGEGRKFSFWSKNNAVHKGMSSTDQEMGGTLP